MTLALVLSLLLGGWATGVTGSGATGGDAMGPVYKIKTAMRADTTAATLSSGDFTVESNLPYIVFVAHDSGGTFTSCTGTYITFGANQGGNFLAGMVGSASGNGTENITCTFSTNGRMVMAVFRINYSGGTKQNTTYAGYPSADLTMNSTIGTQDDANNQIVQAGVHDNQLGSPITEFWTSQGGASVTGAGWGITYASYNTAPNGMTQDCGWNDLSSSLGTDAILAIEVGSAGGGT